MDPQFGLRCFTLIVIIIRSVVAPPFADTFLAVPDDNRNRLFLAVPVNSDPDGSPDWAVRDDIQQRRAAGDPGVIDVDDYVARPDACFCSGAARHDILNDHTTVGF